MSGQDTRAEDEALNQIHQGDFVGAIASANAALEKNPHDCWMLTVRGLALKSMGEPVKAIRGFESAAMHCPTFLPALEGLAETQYAQRSPQAPSTLKKILALQPEDQTSHAMLAIVEARTGNCADAVSHFKKAEELIGTDTDAERQYGVCLLATDEAESAKNVFEKLLQQQDTPLNRVRYAYACWKGKDNKAGLKALDPLITQAPLDPKALTLAARLEEASGDTPSAVDALQKAIALEPLQPQNYLLFAEIAFNHSSPKVGVDMSTVGIARLPQEARLYVARGVLEAQDSQFDSAMADFRKAHQLDPRLSLAGDAMGIMLDQQHQTTQSLAAYAAQVKAHPNDALVQYLYAEALSQGDPSAHQAAALAAARQAVKLEPDYQAAIDLLGQLEFRAGNTDRALDAAKAAAARDPEDESAIYQELMAYRRLGNKDQVNELVAKLKEVKEHHRQAGMNYQLEEISKPSSP